MRRQGGEGSDNLNEVLWILPTSGCVNSSYAYYTSSQTPHLVYIDGYVHAQHPGSVLQPDRYLHVTQEETKREPPILLLDHYEAQICQKPGDELLVILVIVALSLHCSHEL